MKFKPCSIIFFILVSFSSFGQNLNDDAAYFFYRYDKSVIKRNKIASLTIDLVVMDNKPGATKVHYFDKEGNLTKISDLDSNGVTKGEYFFFVNEHQDLVTRIFKDYELNKKDTVRYFKSYEKGKLIKDSSTEYSSSTEFSYNPSGQIIQKVSTDYFSKNNFRKKIVSYTLDGLGRINNCKESFYMNKFDTIGTIYSNRDYYYNKQGLLEKEFENIKNTDLVGTITYHYNPLGQLVLWKREKGATYSYTYNSKGLLTTVLMDMYVEPDAFMPEEINILAKDIYRYSTRF
jgi:YD repeat-containing protein